MKFKTIASIIGLVIFILSAPPAEARTPIRGTIFGENFGLIHLDYTTATRPDGYAGDQIDFYIPPWDPEFTGSGLIDFTAQVYDLSDGDRCNDSSCLLTGFLWNDRIGWIILDGEQIQNSFSDPDDFPEALFARVNFSGQLTGYAWSEHAGWVKLASDDAAGTNTPPALQTLDRDSDITTADADWGVFLDPDSDITTIDRPDPEDDITWGRPLQGYAWSEALGWIKFAPDDGESFTGLAEPGASGGAYTNWVPDTSPPEFYGENNVWFKNSHVDGVVTWPAIAADPESGIREDSRLTVTRDPRDEFAGCNTPIPEMVSHNLEGGTLSLTIPSIGRLQGAMNGFCRYLLTGVINNNAGLSFVIGEGTPIVFSVRAGDLDETKSNLDGGGAAIAAIADGIDEVEYNLKLLDLADNPIVSIAEGPGRAVTVTASFDNDMSFDTIAFPLNKTFPVRVNSAYLGDPEAGEDLVSTPPEGGILFEGDRYPLMITSFSPSTSSPAIPFGTSLEFQGFDVVIEEEDLLPVSIRAGVGIGGIDGARRSYVFAKPEAMADPVFLPALIAESGQIQTGELLDQITVGISATLSFTLKNQSLTETLNHFNLDTIFEYEGGMGATLFETQAIDHLATPSESILAWSDPLVPGGAHYELYKGNLDPAGTPIDGLNSQFHASYPITGLAEDGSYPVDPIYLIPNNVIDRSDAIEADPIEGELIIGPNGVSPSQQIEFTTVSILPDDVSDVNISIPQELAYRFDTQPLFTLYKPDDLVPGVEVNSTGAQFKGIGVGEDIYSNRELDVIGSQGVKNLAEQMRRNVADMTLNLSPCDAAPFEGVDTLTLLTSNSCIKTDTQNKTMIAYFEGDENEFLNLGDGSEKTIFVPSDTRYTIILKGGLNLYLRNNVAFADDTSALGIIILGAEGRGANVYLDPAPTNMVGNLYAEGSLLSSPDPAGGLLYYGGVNPSALSNQLYWQGSIASLNTLGGASSNLLPQGITCPAGITPYQCAQRYDMNFLRRFSAGTDAIANNGKFSGGGSCLPPPGVCSLGPLTTTVSLDAAGLILPVGGAGGSKSLDAFFIEPSARPSPPGFRITGEQESSQVIR